jgi:hypothetical protein
MGSTVVDPEDILSAFADGEMVQLWAKEKVATAIHNGLVLGFNGELRPSAAITRAETIAIVHRLLIKAGLIEG